MTPVAGDPRPHHRRAAPAAAKSTPNAPFSWMSTRPGHDPRALGRVRHGLDGRDPVALDDDAARPERLGRQHVAEELRGHPVRRCYRPGCGTLSAWTHWATSASARGAADATCTSASRSTTSASSRCCGPDAQIDTVVTADAYGEGDADELVGRALAGLDRAAYRLVGAVGHDFYERRARRRRRAIRASPTRGCAGPDAYADYLRMATERSLERCGADHFDLLLLHNPDRIGYSSRGGLGRDGARCATRASPTRSASRRARRTASRST